MVTDPSVAHALDQSVRMRFPDSCFWLLWFCRREEPHALCHAKTGHWGLTYHGFNLRGGGHQELSDPWPLFSRFVGFSGNTIPLIIRKLSVNLHSVVPRAINQTRDLIGSCNS